MRLIDAELLKNTMERLIKEEKECYNTSPESWEKEIENFKTLIDTMPTVEAKPVVHAHWVTDFDFDPEEEQELYFYFCSKCKKELFGDKEDFKYCPYCGAQMDELVSKTDELNSSEKPNSCDHIAEAGKKENDNG